MLAPSKILTRPREAFPQLVAAPSLPWILAFASLGGVERALGRLIKDSMAQAAFEPLSHVLAVNVASGIVIGASLIWPASWLFAWSARQLGGDVSSSAMRTILAWSQLTAIPVVLYMLVLFAVEGRDVLLFDRVHLFHASPVLVGCFFLVQFACGAWRLVLAVAGLSEVAGISGARAFGAYVLGVLAVFVPLMCVLIVAMRLTR
jgi:hypothetical protein